MAVGPIDIDNHFVQWWKIVLYGPPGCGKSVMSCSSKKYRTFVFQTDMDGLASVKAWKIRHKLETHVRFWPCKTQADFMAGWQWLYGHRREFDLVVVDTWTELLSMNKREAFARGGNPLQNWGSVLDVMDLMTSQFKELEWHVVIVCHETVVTDVVTKQQVVRPAFRGSWKEEYARHFSAIVRYTMWHAEVKENNRMVPTIQRWLDCGPNPSIHYKDRSGMLNRWEAPDIDGLLDKLMSSQRNGTELAAAMEAAATAEQPDDPAIVAFMQAQEKEKEKETES